MHILKEWVERICEKTIAFPLSDNFINSPDLFSWLCIDIVSGTLMLLTLFNRLRVRAFEMIWIRISDPRSLGSWLVKWIENPLFGTRIHRFIWSTMIRVISDLLSWSGSSQRNAPWDCTRRFSFFYCGVTIRGWAMPSILTTVLFPVLWLSTFI